MYMAPALLISTLSFGYSAMSLPAMAEMLAGSSNLLDGRPAHRYTG
jgi:hypothetical protein